jgi:hypothetical protein
VPGGAAGRARTAQGKRGGQAYRRELDLEVARRVDGEKQRPAEQQDLRLKEKDRLIEDLRTALDEARRKTRAGLAGAPGRGVEDRHRGRTRSSVCAGCDPARGEGRARRRPRARGERPHPASGTIVWEIKNTRHWQLARIDKLKADQPAIGANLAVLVSTAVPDSLVEFGHIDGVWVAGLRAWPPLAVALREQLIEVAFAHAAAEGKSEQVELLYRYPAGDHRGDGRGLHGAAQWTDPRAQCDGADPERARRADRAGARRHCRHICEVRGIVGATAPPVPALDLDAVAGRLEDATADMVTG